MRDLERRWTQTVRTAEKLGVQRSYDHTKFDRDLVEIMLFMISHLLKDKYRKKSMTISPKRFIHNYVESHWLSLIITIG